MKGFKKPQGYETFRSVSEIAKYVGVSARTVERWYEAEVIPPPAHRTEAGIKLWSPEQCQRILDWRISQLPSEKRRQRRIMKT